MNYALTLHLNYRKLPPMPDKIETFATADTHTAVDMALTLRCAVGVVPRGADVIISVLGAPETCSCGVDFTGLSPEGEREVTGAVFPAVALAVVKALDGFVQYAATKGVDIVPPCPPGTDPNEHRAVFCATQLVKGVSYALNVAREMMRENPATAGQRAAQEATKAAAPVDGVPADAAAALAQAMQWLSGASPTGKV